MSSTEFSSINCWNRIESSKKLDCGAQMERGEGGESKGEKRGFRVGGGKLKGVEGCEGDGRGARVMGVRG